MAEFQSGFGQDGDLVDNGAASSAAQQDGGEEVGQDLLLLIQWNEEEEELAKLKERLRQLEKQHAETGRELRLRGVKTVADGTPDSSSTVELLKQQLNCTAEEALALDRERYYSAKSVQSPDNDSVAHVDRSPSTHECYPGIVYQSIEHPRNHVQPEVAERSPVSDTPKSDAEHPHSAPASLPEPIPAKTPPYPFTWVLSDGETYQSVKKPLDDDQVGTSDIAMVMDHEPSYQDQLEKRLRPAPIGPLKEYNWIVKPNECAAPPRQVLVLRTDHIYGTSSGTQSGNQTAKFQEQVKKAQRAISELAAAESDKAQDDDGRDKHPNTRSLVQPHPIYYPQRQKQFDQGVHLESMLNAHKRRDVPASELYAAQLPSKAIPATLADETESLVAARLVHDRLLGLHDDQRFKSLKIIRTFPGIDQDCTLHDLLKLLQFDDTVPVQIEMNDVPESLVNMTKLVYWRDNGNFHQVEMRIGDRKDAFGPLPGFLLEVTVVLAKP